MDWLKENSWNTESPPLPRNELMIAVQIWRVTQNCFVRRCHSKLKSACVVMEKGVSYYAAFADKPVYFRELTEARSEEQNEVPDSTKMEISSVFCEPHSVFVAETSFTSSSDHLDEYIKSCMVLHPLFRSNDSSKYEIAIGTVQENGPFNIGGHVKRCLFFSGKFHETTEPDRFLKQNTVLDDVNIFRLTQCDKQNLFERKIVKKSNDENEMGKITNFELIRPLDLKTRAYFVSPMFTSEVISPVFHTLERSLNILNKLTDIKEVEELLQVKEKELPDLVKASELREQMEHDFVVVEGMDATGKTTLTDALQIKLGAARYCTPPPCIQHLRRFFDALPEIVRRAYYSLGNYIVAVQIAKECQERPVIMDRYWHSTAAYGIANECSLSDLPPEGHVTYNWPDDLLKPTCVLSLTVTEAVRKQRMNQRDLAMTFEEKSLDRDGLFRQRLCEAYRRMRNPKCVEIDASGTREMVAEMAKNTVLEHSIKKS